MLQTNLVRISFISIVCSETVEIAVRSEMVMLLNLVALLVTGNAYLQLENSTTSVYV